MGLSTHILDTALGRPAANVPVILERRDEGGWRELNRTSTNQDGRCSTLLGDNSLEASTYRLRFGTAEYYAAHHLNGLYPWVDIVFSIEDPTQHYHIPLLLTANGYTTYRGS